MVEFALATHAFISDASRPLSEQVEETAEIVRLADRLGTFGAIRVQHHWLSYPTVWIEPLPLMARLVPDTGRMRLMTSVLKLAIHNPVEIAHQIATLDHLSNGRVTIGIATGYQEEELEAVGATRKERTPRLEESLALMKALWTGEEVTFEGKFWSVHNVRMGYTPVQKPHPPIWNAAQSVGAARRAARVCDGVLIAPQISWKAVAGIAADYRQALQTYGKASGCLGMNRHMSVAPTYEEAELAARASATKSASYYGRWRMDESTIPDLVLDAERDPRDWCIVGTPQDCVEQLQQQIAEIGIDSIGLGFANAPKAHSARLEFLQYVSEEVLGKVIGG